MATFTPFPRLPTELRAQIWAMTVTPRTVDVRVRDGSRVRQRGKTPRWRVTQILASSTPAPAIVQACQEARYQGLYQQAFSEIPEAETTGRRYVWLNLEIDMVSIGGSYLDSFLPVAPLIRRLKLERAISVDHHAWEIPVLRDFFNVKEMHIVCLDGMRTWHEVSQDWYFPCGRENLFFVNPDDGSIIRCIEMDLMFDEIVAEENRRYDEENPPSEDEST